MFISKKKKIQRYLDQKSDGMDVFDLLLSEYLSGEMLQKLNSLDIQKAEIFVDWVKGGKCIGIQGRFRTYFVDVQIYPDEFGISIDVDEPDDDVMYALESREQLYSALADALKEN